MLEKNKQEASNISDSFVQQANGNINNYGLGYNEVKEICRDVIRQELAIVTREASDTLNKEISTFENQFVERLEKLENPQVIDKLKTPKLQFSLHDTMKEYAQSDNIETKEDLMDFLIDRLQVDENSTEQFVINDAIQILPKLSFALTRFLGALLMRRMEERNISFIFRMNLKVHAKLYEHLDEISNLDLAYLNQLNCCQTMPGLSHMVTIEEEMRIRYDLFFRHPTTQEEYNYYISSHPILASGIRGRAFICIDTMNNNECRMVYLSSNHLKEDLQKEGKMDMWPELQAYIDTLRPYTDEEIRDFLISTNPNWGKLINLFHQENIQRLQLTPVGVYIANKIVQKEKMRVAHATLKELF